MADANDTSNIISQDDSQKTSKNTSTIDDIDDVERSCCTSSSSVCSNIHSSCTDESASYKFFNFFFYGAVQTFNSYVSVYLKTLGLTASHVGLINGTHPLLQIIGAPLAGILGDRYKIKRLLLLVGLVTMTVRTMLYLPFQPKKQVCTVVYVNSTHHKVISSMPIQLYVLKRSKKHNYLEYETSFLIDNGNMTEEMMKTLNNLSDFSKRVRSNSELNPFLTRPNVIIKKTKDYKLVYVKINDQDEIEQIFLILLCLTLFGEVFEALVSTIADTCCLDYLGEARESFGMFRFWGALGAGITSPISGAIFDYYGKIVCGRTVSGYHCIFFIYFVYLCASFIAATHFHYRYDGVISSSKEKNIKEALLNLNYGIFILVTMFMGLCYGFLTSFGFWFLDDLGANAVLLGVASSLRSVAENIVYFVSPFVLVRIGHVYVAGGCLIAFSIACLAYSYLLNPWFAIPLEVLSTSAYAFSWTTCVSYLNKAAPPGSSTIVQGIVQASFWGLGFGGGSIVGGFSFRVFGDRETFRGFSIASLAVLLFFILVQLMIKSNKQEERNSSYQTVSGEDEAMSSNYENTALE
ncbi:major facilitator superfamily domain-containing protein 6-like [Xenia sp. Carnegie-2017]|uniref:major facilitator superfamily domain-containing protein 6-like n=1 Tax=Xenia sp. Carnegie-2017 TaxID=2897299 RepID=UPI001F046E09|nr:major facilitator superfamily domain-containing protein 6-like [Xenia sp. Carnegie-2017]